MVERDPHKLRSLYVVRLVQLEDAYARLRNANVLNHAHSYFPIALVTNIEVFFRNSVSELIDAGSPFVERIEPLAKDIKFDVEAVRALQGRSITLGEVVSLGPAFQSLDAICSVMTTITGSDFLKTLATVYDRAQVELNGRPKQPIIADIGQCARTLSHLFECRHVVVHETPRKLPFSKEDVVEFMATTKSFLKATDEYVANLIHPNYPLTQYEMNVEAAQETRKAVTEMDGVIAAIAKFLSDDRKLQFDQAQEAWEAYRDRMADFEADEFAGGSIRPMIYQGAAAALTRSRTEGLQGLLTQFERLYGD
jgi:uncharacterized protein YecT (DUF1311 family)